MNAEMQKQLKAKRDTIDSNHPPTALTLKEYTGNYEHEVYGEMNIVLENDKLIMRFEHHKGRYGNVGSIRR